MHARLHVAHRNIFPERRRGYTGRYLAYYGGFLVYAWKDGGKGLTDHLRIFRCEYFRVCSGRRTIHDQPHPSSRWPILQMLHDTFSTNERGVLSSILP